MLEQARNTLGNRQTKAQAFTGVSKSAKFLEDQLSISMGNAWSGIPDLDRKIPAAPATAEDNAPAARVAHGVGKKILYNAAQQLRIAAHPSSRNHAIQVQATLLGENTEFRSQTSQSFIDRESLDPRARAPTIES